MDPIIGGALITGGAGLLSSLFGGGSSKVSQTTQIDPTQKAYIEKMMEREEYLWPVLEELLGRLPKEAQTMYLSAITEPSAVHSSVMGNLMGTGPTFNPSATPGGTIGSSLNDYWNRQLFPETPKAETPAPPPEWMSQMAGFNKAAGLPENTRNLLAGIDEFGRALPTGERAPTYLWQGPLAEGTMANAARKLGYKPGSPEWDSFVQAYRNWVKTGNA